MTPEADQSASQTLLTDADRLQGYLEMWKQTITVQQHFNEIGWKIRGLALTALTFTLGAASLTATTKDQPAPLIIRDVPVDRSALTLCIGSFIWLAFSFVDLSWYHRLLKGSVNHGRDLEQELRNYLPVAGLTIAISAASPSRPLPWSTKEMHSTWKLRLFYIVIAALLAVVAVVLQLNA